MSRVFIALLFSFGPALASAAWPDRSLNDKIISQGVPEDALLKLEAFLESNDFHDFSENVYYCDGRETTDVRPCDEKKRHPGVRTVSLKPHDYSVIVDYSKPSRAKRFYLIDWKTGVVESELTTHGQGSGETDYPLRFSNRKDSNATSLGFYLTGEVYHGYHGLTLRLYGLEPSNDRAYVRDIVVHGAWYVSPEFPQTINPRTKKPYERLGLSWGCPALNPKVASKVIPEITGGAVLYHYVPVNYHPPSVQAPASSPVTPQPPKRPSPEELTVPNDQTQAQSPSIESSLPSSSSALKSE